MAAPMTTSSHVSSPILSSPVVDAKNGPPHARWEVAQIAEVLGTPLMPWQRHVVDIAYEINPDTGRLVYREVRPELVSSPVGQDDVDARR
jgi:hypothetical protein